MTANNFHINFKLNGQSFSSIDELFEYSKTLSSSTNEFLEDWFSNENSVSVKTSGSTGKPKVIQLKKEFMKNSAMATGEFFNLPAQTTALLCMSTEYIAGKMMLVRAMILGWHLDVVKPISNPLKKLDKQYDFSAMVPLQLENSLSEIESIKKLIVGGGIVSQELEKQIQDISTEVFAMFGMTETITHIAVRKLNNFHPTNLASVSTYKLLPNVSVFKDDRSCLVIDAPEVSDAKVVTNDVVEVVSKNEFKWLGRFDHVINSGGIKLHPEEIEKKLSNTIAQRFFVAGIPDQTLGEKLVLIVEENAVSNQVEKSFKSQLLIKLKNILTKYETPKQIFLVGQFVETETKKIQRSKTLNLLFKD